MNLEIANSMSGYIETLYYMNKNLLKLCGVWHNNKFDYEKLVLDIIQDIPRLIPYSYDNKANTLIFKDSEGLLEYQDKIKYLKKDYEEILKENEIALDKIRKIRNKYEHKMHGIKYISSGSGSFSLFDIEFKINNEFIEITAGELIGVIKKINILFSKIIYDISKYAYENGKTDYLYYERITRFEFKDFNEILESDLLRKIGKIMSDY